ncbi:CidA/LrgA family protein [Pseudochrobactrum asaccharolyticum]|uniref:CidA/LrgA family protein n=1 Tax=Pseudochrobactrum asaccharolyticum TaxID=354351 RepID=UPI0040418EB7
MSPAQLSGGVRHWVQSSRIGQIALIAGFWALGEGIARVTHMPVPGSVVGLFLLFILLMTGGMNLLTVRRGAQWYLAEMLLFFIPAVLAVLDHHEFFGLLGLKILAVILLGTVIVMISTALAVEAGLRLSRHLQKMRHSS